jgi:site-specific DNA-methyltransferase (adenine-specific)
MDFIVIDREKTEVLKRPLELDIDNIYNMDCVDGMRKLDDDSIDCVVTSPPYDTMRTYGGVGDGWNFDKFKDVAKEIARVLKPGGVCVWVVNDETIDGTESGTSFRQALYFKDECGLNIHDTMIWEKTCSGCLGSTNCYLQNFEYMFVFSKGAIKTFNPIEDRKNVAKPHKNTTNGGLVDGKGKQRAVITKEYGRRTNIWQINQQQNSDHPAPFPDHLAESHVISWTNEGDVVLDPFMGSATTAVACHKYKRHFIGFELNKEYYDKAVKRIKAEQAQLTLF